MSDDAPIGESVWVLIDRTPGTGASRILGVYHRERFAREDGARYAEDYYGGAGKVCHYSVEPARLV